MKVPHATRAWRAVRRAFAFEGGVAPWESRGLCIAFAFSAAHLNLLPLWRTTVFASETARYFFPVHHAHDYAAALTLLCGLAGAIYAALSLVRRAPARLVPWLLLLLSVVCLVNPVYSARMQLLEVHRFSRTLFDGGVLACAVAGLLLLWRLGAGPSRCPSGSSRSWRRSCRSPWSGRAGSSCRCP